MTLAALFLLGALLGWLMPRDAFPWMRRLSAWFMRGRDNRELATVLMVVGALLLVALVLAGCSKQEPAPAPRFKAWIGSAGTSMLPTIPERALVEIEVGFPYNQLTEGRVAVFADPASPVGLTLHTLVAKQAGAWISRGDNNRVADRVWVTPENYIGVWTGNQALVIAAPR